MKRKIITDISYLKQKSCEIGLEESVKLENIIKDLEDSLDLKRGVGLSAIQIGYPVRVGIIRLPKLTLNLINPIILEKYDRFRFPKERCLSLIGLTIDTSRYNEIFVNNNGEMLVFMELEAVVVQHEINHMDGKLIIDKGIKWQKRR